MAYVVLTPDVQAFARPSWRPEDDPREIVELPLHAAMQHSRGHLWRYPPGVKGRRHRQTVQEEVFVVLEGTLTMVLGEAGERVELPPRSIVFLEPMTPVHVLNESDGDVLFFAYGAPADRGAEILE